MDTDAVYGSDEGVDKTSNPKTGRMFMGCNIIAIIVLVAIIALYADIKDISKELTTNAKRQIKV